MAMPTMAERQLIDPVGIVELRDGARAAATR